MYKNILVNCVLLSSFFFRFLAPCVARTDKAKKIDSILIGVYEKGAQIGTQIKLSRSSSLLFSFSYLDLTLGEYDMGLSKKIPFNFSQRGGLIEYSKYLNQDIDKTGNFVTFGLELSRLDTSSTIRLSDLEFDLKPLKVTCRTCENYILESSQDFKFVPRIAIGRQYKLGSNIFVKTSIGVQYYTLPQINGKYESEYKLPFYVKEELLEAQNKINRNLRNFPTICPTVNINFIYKI